ncbi:MAG: hypothetical protein KGJ86_02335 [Chloroflexota bacterium]|nr:hypothetical protein [Chloroflexota bacterium]
MSLTAAFDPEAARQGFEYCYEHGWTDGLPVIPPTEEHVRQFLDGAGRDPDEIVARAPHLGKSCTVRQAAMNAVMAGCLPEYFPVVLAALESIWGKGAGFANMQSTTGPCPMIVVNGPIRQQIGINCQGNALGPGFRANATIGRTLRLVVLNVFGVRPHGLDQATQSTPAKYTFCFGENEEESPWEPLHVELGLPAGTSAVTTYTCRGNMHVENRHSQDPEKVLLTIADAMSYAGGPSFYRRSASCVVMGPEHAQLLARAGWSKAQVKQFLWEHFGRRLGEMRRVGRGDFEEHREGVYNLVEKAHEGHRLPEAENMTDETFINFGPSPDGILLVVAGAKNAGVSTVVPPMAGQLVDAIKTSTVAVRPAN